MDLIPSFLCEPDNPGLPLSASKRGKHKQLVANETMPNRNLRQPFWLAVSSCNCSQTYVTVSDLARLLLFFHQCCTLISTAQIDDWTRRSSNSLSSDLRASWVFWRSSASVSVFVKWRARAEKDIMLSSKQHHPHQLVRLDSNTVRRHQYQENSNAVNMNNHGQWFSDIHINGLCRTVIVPNSSASVFVNCRPALQGFWFSPLGAESLALIRM